MNNTALDYKKTKAYFRNDFVPFEEANLSVASSPVLYGLSIYSVFGVEWNEQKSELVVFRLKDHYERLVRSANIMDFNSFTKGWPYDRFKKTILDLIELNSIKESVLVRVTVFVDELVAGTRIHGLKNSLSAYIYPKGQILSKSGVNLCVSSWTRSQDNSIPSRAKVNGGYINSSLMKNEALLNGYDDSIAIDEHGHVAESSVANIFLVRNGVLITPGQSTDILEGITRDTIIALARGLGIEVVERSVDRSELYICDEAFVCGTSADIVSVRSIDKRRVCDGGAGKVTKILEDAYSKSIKGDNDFCNKWCTIIGNKP